jgi:uncharacterized membrane protein
MKTSSFARWSGLSLIASCLLQLPIGTIQQLYPVSPPSVDFSIRNSLIALTHALVLLGVLGFARSGAIGESVLGKIGLGLALVGGVLFIPAELSIQVDLPLGATLDGICSMVLGLGLALAGIAVLRSGRWQGWRRFIPLLFGLYPFLVINPFIFATGQPNFISIGLWGVPALLLGVALLSEPKVAVSRAAPLAAVR